MTATSATTGTERAQRTAFPALPVLRRWMAEGRRSLLGWSAGVAGVAVLYLPLFPSMQSPELAELVASLPPELVRTLGYGDITSGAGYTQATIFGLIGFVLLTIAGVSWGAAFIGGAEESGRLELMLSHGVGRVQYA
ncbi:MAG: ABC transporter permease, partial [Actinomycetota bacterium]|nr:ABC transporter permease [Actinomycetota bacterium]